MCRAISKALVGGRRRGVEDVHHRPDRSMQEVVDQRAVALRPPGRAPRPAPAPGPRRGRRARSRAQALGERRGATATGHLADPGAPVLRGEPPASPGSAACRRSSRGLTVPPAVALSGQREHGVGPGVRRAPPMPRVRCTPRNGKRRVGHRVDQVAHQRAARAAQLEVLAAERHDPHGRGRRPASRATSSQCRPAQATTRRPRGRPPWCARWSSAPSGRTETSAPEQPRWLAARLRGARTSASHDGAVVDDRRCAGTCRAATRADVRLVLPGLLARCSRVTRRRWRGRARAARARPGSSSSRVATTSLPQISWGMASSSANATIDAAPARHISAFFEPGA